jgi:hypothetical protein
MVAVVTQLAATVPPSSASADRVPSVSETLVSAGRARVSALEDPPPWPASLPGDRGSERLANAVYYTDFSTPLGSEWVLYDSIGHAGWGLRRPSAISVEADPDAESGQLLTITAQMGTEGDEAGLLVSGGMKLLIPQLFGRYTFRIRVDPDPDEATSGVGLLWPQSLQWPRDGEIDIFETWASRDTRNPVETNIHYLAPGAAPPYTIEDDRILPFTWDGVDGTEWNVFQLTWRPDQLTVAINGGLPVELTTNPAEIPQTPMELTFQLDAFDQPDRPGQQPVLSGQRQLEVDWVLVEPLPEQP